MTATEAADLAATPIDRVALSRLAELVAQAIHAEVLDDRRGVERSLRGVVAMGGAFAASWSVAARIGEPGEELLASVRRSPGSALARATLADARAGRVFAAAARFQLHAPEVAYDALDLLVAATARCDGGAR